METWNDYGYKEFKKGEVAYVIFKDDSGDGTQVHSLWNPDWTEIMKGAREMGLDEDRVCRIIREREPDCYGFLFEVTRFKAYCEEEKMKEIRKHREASEKRIKDFVEKMA